MATRPTGARARAAIFDIIAHGLADSHVPPLGGAVVLDVFAGAGAMGFEALSRGGAFITFIENASPARRAIEANASALGVEDQARVLNGDATRPPPAQTGDAAAIAFFDPPYRDGLLVPALAALAAAGWLAKSALIVAEHHADDPVVAPTGFTDLIQRTYGGTGVTFLQYRGDE